MHSTRNWATTDTEITLLILNALKVFPLFPPRVRFKSSSCVEGRRRANRAPCNFQKSASLQPYPMRHGLQVVSIFLGTRVFTSFRTSAFAFNFQLKLERRDRVGVLEEANGTAIPEIHTASILDGTVLSSLLNHTLLGKRGVGRPRHLEAVLRKKLEREREKHHGSLE